MAIQLNLYEAVLLRGLMVNYDDGRLRLVWHYSWFANLATRVVITASRQ